MLRAVSGGRLWPEIPCARAPGVPSLRRHPAWFPFRGESWRLTYARVASAPVPRYLVLAASPGGRVVVRASVADLALPAISAPRGRVGGSRPPRPMDSGSYAPCGHGRPRAKRCSLSSGDGAIGACTRRWSALGMPEAVTGGRPWDSSLYLGVDAARLR